MEKEIVKVYLYPAIDVTEDDDARRAPVVWIDPNDVEQIIPNKKSPIIRIGKKLYRPLLTLDGFEEAWLQFGMCSVDTGFTVNLKKIKVFDKKRSLLYFDEYPTKDSVAISVARIHHEHIESVMEQYGIRYLSDTQDQTSKNNHVIDSGVFKNPSYSY
jgi:hypothetical protein